LAGTLRRKLHLSRFLDKHMNKKFNMAMDLFIESVIKPDHELRNDARDHECLDELLHIREDVLEYLYTIRRRNDGVIPVSTRSAE